MLSSLLSALFVSQTGTTTTAYEINESSIASLTLEDGWLVGQSLDGTPMVTYPVRFGTQSGHSKEINAHGEIAVWKVNKSALVWSPGRFKNDFYGGGYGMVVVPLSIPDPSPLWTEEEADSWSLSDFVQAIPAGSLTYSSALLNLRNDVRSLESKLNAATADVNMTDPDEVKRIKSSLRSKLTVFMNECLKSINKSLYGPLAFQSTRLPRHIVSLAKLHKSNATTTTSRSLMMLNRFLIDRHRARSASQLFPVTQQDFDSPPSYFNCEVYSSSLFPINPVLTDIFGSTYLKGFKNITVRPTTSQENLTFKQSIPPKPALAYPSQKGPKGFNDTTPHIYVKVNDSVWILNAAGAALKQFISRD